MAASSFYIPIVSSSCLLPLQETLQDQQVDLTQAPFKLLLFPWVLECVWFCVHPLRVESRFPQPSGTHKSKSRWPSKPMFWGLIVLVQDLQAGETDMGLRPLTPWGEPL